MIRSAALCLLMAAAILPDLANAQEYLNSDWNPTDLTDDAFIGILVGAGLLLILIIIVIAVCCCCFLCPGLFGNLACCGPTYEPEPYFEPPPQYYPPPPQPEPLPQPYPVVIQQAPPEPEPVYIVKNEPEPRRERVHYIARERRDDYHDYDRRVIIRSPRSSFYGNRGHSYYDYDDRRYDDHRYIRSSSPSYIRRGDYY